MDSCQLTEEATQRYKKEFEKMCDDEKWFLRKGRNGEDIYVEDVMYAFGSKWIYEQ